MRKNRQSLKNWHDALDAWKRNLRDAQRRSDAEAVQCAARWVDYWTRRVTGRI